MDDCDNRRMIRLMPSRRAVAGIAVLAILTDTALWAVATWMLGRSTARWSAQAQAHGWTVSSAGQEWGGWPFAASLTIGRVAIGGGARYVPGGCDWSADRVVASVSVAHPLTLRLAAEGQQFLRVAHAPDLAFVAASAVARLPLVQGRRTGGTLDLAGVSGGIAGSGHPQDVQVGALSVVFEADQDQPAARAPAVARLGVRARRVGLPDIGRWPLGAIIASLGADAVLTVPSAGPGPDGERRDASDAAAWRDGGGTLVLENFGLRWGPLGVAASARLGLDPRLQPAGDGTAEVSGSGQALDAAAQAGVIAPGLALTAKAALAVMTEVQTPDGPAVRLPFLLRRSTISVGGIPVTQVPDIRW